MKDYQEPSEPNELMIKAGAVFMGKCTPPIHQYVKSKNCYETVLNRGKNVKWHVLVSDAWNARRAEVEEALAGQRMPENESEISETLDELISPMAEVAIKEICAQLQPRTVGSIKSNAMKDMAKKGPGGKSASQSESRR